MGSRKQKHIVVLVPGTQETRNRVRHESLREQVKLKFLAATVDSMQEHIPKADRKLKKRFCVQTHKLRAIFLFIRIFGSGLQTPEIQSYYLL